jgi:hypothetical protein
MEAAALETAGAASIPAPAATPAAAAPAAPAAIPAPAATPAPAMGDGGSGSSIKDVISGLNWTEVIFGILGSAALYYTIYFYRYKMAEGKALNTEMLNKIDDIEIKLGDLQSASQRDGLIGNSQAGFDGFL